MSGDGGVTETSTEYIPAERIPPHGRGRLAPLWKKGQSGNPLGVRNREYEQARALCAENTLVAVQRQIELIGHEDGRIALVACAAVLDRGIGKPRDHSGEASTRLDLSALDAAERAALMLLLRKVLGGSAT